MPMLWPKAAVIFTLALGLAACETTSGTGSTAGSNAGTAMGSTAPFATQTSASQTRTETLADGTVRTVTTSSDGGFSFSFNSGGTSAPGGFAPLSYAGSWQLKNDYAKSCTLNLGTSRTGQYYQASKSGFCAMGFDKVAAWSVSGNQLFLLDAQGQVRGRLTADGSGAFSGTYDDGVFSPERVTLRRI